MKAVNLKEERITTLMNGRIGGVLEGFYCGFSPASVAHYTLYMELRRNRNTRTQVLELPYFRDWAALRKQKMEKEGISLIVFPNLVELENESIAEINSAVITNRIDAANTETLAGMKAMVESVDTTRHDGWTFDTFFDAVIREAEELMDIIGVSVARQRGAGTNNMFALTIKKPANKE